MGVQKVPTPGSTTESWTLLGDDLRPVDPVESFLVYLTAIERSLNTIKTYAHDPKDWWTYLDGRSLDWKAVAREGVAAFVAWLLLPPLARNGAVAVLPTVEHHCAASSVNRKLTAVSTFYEFHARSGIEVADLLVTMRPAGWHRSSATSCKPFLQHIASRKPERTRTIKLKSGRKRPRVLIAAQAQRIMDGCERLSGRRRILTPLWAGHCSCSGAVDALSSRLFAAGRRALPSRYGKFLYLRK
ncbi:site-specific integrase (plasmid) [Streptomyces sp. QH1-20]|uniref:site-specific integrase n=1 Tax=Streptomyces sp. QH1-20 TaxID=3240934 RepID=UPI003514BC18